MRSVDLLNAWTQKQKDGDPDCESGEDGAHMSGKRREECCKQKDEAH